MDLSGLIFVALAVAWAAYLIPKALRHHDDVVRGRSVDRFSESMRVLARREPVSSTMATLVVTPARAAGAAMVSTKRRVAAEAPRPAETHQVRRQATRRATRRRRRVLLLLLLVLAAVVGACADHLLAWPYVAVPAGLLLAWLVACRVMVRSERARWRGSSPHAVDDETGEAADPDDGDESAGDEAAQPAESAGPPASGPAGDDPELWDPVPVTLPTYVSKPPARRSVRTIDLDSTGVWTSGRTEATSALAREADAAEAAERVRRRVSRKDEASDEAVGS